MASMMSCCGWVCRHAARHSRPDVTIAIRDCAGARWAWAWLLACTCVDGRRRRRSICCISAAAACAALPSSSACIYLHADGCTARHQAMCGPRARLHVHYAGSTQVAHRIYRACGAAPLSLLWCRPWNRHSPSYYGHPASVCRNTMHCDAQKHWQTLRQVLEAGTHSTCQYAHCTTVQVTPVCYLLLA